MPEMEEVTTTEGASARRSAGRAACRPSNTPRTFTARTRSRWSGAICSSGQMETTPAFRTSVSRCSKRSVAHSTMPALHACVLTSPANAAARSRPSSQARLSSRRSTPTTDAPASSSCSAVARPIPDPAPVTTATRPSHIAVISHSSAKADPTPVSVRAFADQAMLNSISMPRRRSTSSPASRGRYFHQS